MMVELYAGETLLGTFPVSCDDDVKATIRACPVVVTSYNVVMPAAPRVDLAPFVGTMPRSVSWDDVARSYFPE